MDSTNILDLVVLVAFLASVEGWHAFLFSIILIEEHLFYLTTHDYVVILCVPPTFAIPAFVVVVWVREVSPFSRRKASVFVQAVVW